MSRNYQNHPELYPEVSSQDPDLAWLKPCSDWTYVEDPQIEAWIAEQIAHHFAP